jgi:GDPmannose 4,6-dehydratase
MKTALITGITGQDGSYLAELLLSKGYEVHGLIRRCSTSNMQRLTDTVKNNTHFHYGDLSNSENIYKIMKEAHPDEIYNLAAQSQVHTSFSTAEYTGNITGLGITRILESARVCCPDTRIYQASSSEMFGNAPSPQNEETPFHPRSPYACAKLYAYWMVRNYREGYNMFACNGIMFNHESPRRGVDFVTKKITTGIGKILKGEITTLRLGNLDAQRDWGYAPEYVECMWRMLQHDTPGDYVIGTGETHTVDEFLSLACEYAGISKEKHVKIDPELYRPNEVHTLRADATKAKNILGWNPRTSFKELVWVMIENELPHNQK